MGKDAGTWTEERTKKLIELWPKDLFASQIAKIIGGVSRNAVLGKAMRLGLPRRDAPAAERKRKIAPRIPPKKRQFVFGRIGAPTERQDAKPVPDNDNHILPADRVKLADLELHQCRWPVGDPQERDFGFCGAERTPGLPYCHDHMVRAYLPPDRAKRRLQRDLEALKPAKKTVQKQTVEA